MRTSSFTLTALACATQVNVTVVPLWDISAINPKTNGSLYALILELLPTLASVKVKVVEPAASVAVKTVGVFSFPDNAVLTSEVFALFAIAEFSELTWFVKV